MEPIIEGGIYDKFIEEKFGVKLPYIERPETKGGEKVKYFGSCTMKELSTAKKVLYISAELKEKMRKRSKKISNKKAYFKRK